MPMPPPAPPRQEIRAVDEYFDLRSHCGMPHSLRREGQSSKRAMLEENQKPAQPKTSRLWHIRTPANPAARRNRIRAWRCRWHPCLPGSSLPARGRPRKPEQDHIECRGSIREGLAPVADGQVVANSHRALGATKIRFRVQRRAQEVIRQNSPQR